MPLDREQLARTCDEGRGVSKIDCESESLEIANADFFKHLLVTETLQRTDYIAGIVDQHWETR